MFFKSQDIIFKVHNIAFFKKKEDKYFIHYRKKASVKEIEVPIKFGNMQDTQFFMQYKFFILGDYFINIDLISFIHKIPIKDNNIKVLITFVNGLELELNIDRGRFNVWANNRLN